MSRARYPQLIKITFVILLTAIFLSPSFVSASITDGTIDSTYKYAWSENTGWFNFGTTEGNVHITDSALTGYVWAENIGWVSLNCSNDNSCSTVDYKVSNDGEGTLTGYAWSENTGWLNFNPTYGGVTINSSGEFLGYAWGENIGWLVFNCATTNSCGTVDYKVKTDWRPQSARPGGGGLPPVAFSPPTLPPPTTENPEGSFRILINDGAETTNNSLVTLKLLAGKDTKRMAISNFPDFHDAGQIPYQKEISWTLLPISESELVNSLTRQLNNEIIRTVYAKFYTEWGQASEVVSDSIIYKKEVVVSPPKESELPTEEEKEIVPPEEEKPGTKEVEEPIVKLPPPEVTPPTEKPPKPPIIERVPEILKPLIPEILKPKPSGPTAQEGRRPPELPPVEEVVKKEAPLAFQGKWQLLPADPIREFVLAPLPKSIRNLAQKFPELEKTLEEVGVSKITDVAKLKSVKLTLPGLTERAGLSMAKVEPGKFALPQGVPVAKLSPAIKQQLPTEIVFAKTGGELIDFNIALSVTEKGEPQQRISTISGKPLQLAVKPDKPVKSIKGHVVFKSRNLKLETYNSKPETQKFQVSPKDNKLPTGQASFKFQDLTASLIFANPVFAHPVRNEPLVFVEGAEPQSYLSEGIVAGIAISNGASDQDQPVRVEEKLVLLEFEYTDPDGDGIYTAEIQAPVVEGEYEIITVMDFEDPELGMKEIRLITVVDPEGYIYEKVGDKETRIPGAIVSLFWLNPETKQYELWPAKEYQQENPQTTDVRGTYSFLVPEGYYYLKVEAPGYLVYDGKPFPVKEGSGIHINIELKTKYWWLKALDWKIAIIILFGILLAYNFYRDKIRERLMRK